MSIKKIIHYSFTSPASVYDEEALTALELAGRTAAKVNECVDTVNTMEANLPNKIDDKMKEYIEQGSFDAAIDEYAGELEERLDNILSEGGDSTPEIVDMRLGANGETYETAGEAIREQVKEVETGTSKENLIDYNKLEAGYLSESGNISKSHQSGTFNRWEYTTDFIPVTAGLPYVFSIIHDKTVQGWYAITTYDAAKNFIDRSRVYEYNAATYNRKFTLPSTVAYVRISYRSYMTGKAKFEQSMYATNNHQPTKVNNLVDEYPLQFDGYIVDNGSIYPQTAEGYFAGEPALLEKYTRFIPVKAGEEYTLYHKAFKHGWAVVGLYGSDGNAISRQTVNGDSYSFVIPDECVAIRLCARTYYLKDFALFKNVTPMTAEQRSYETYIENLNNEQIEGITRDYDAIVKSVAHRGYSKEAPENTLAAYKLAAKKGYKYVECDLRFTSNNKPVLLHDATIDRTSNGTGNIAEISYNDVKTLDFGSWFSPEYQGEKIPTFDEFLILCKRLGLKAYVELKYGTTTAQVEMICDYVKRTNMKDHVTFISYESSLLLQVNSYLPKSRVGLILNGIPSATEKTILDSMKTEDNEVFMMIPSGYSPSQAILVREYNYSVEVYTVNDESYVKNMNFAVSGVMTDCLHAGKILYDEYSK